MSGDRRLTPANDRVAAVEIADRFPGCKPVAGTPRRIGRAVADLRRAPGGARDRQLLCGDPVRCLETHGGWAFVQSAKDGYVGYVAAGDLTEPETPTHWVTAPATHAYSAADLRSPEVAALSFGSPVRVVGETADFLETGAGFIPRPHLAETAFRFDDPLEAAERFLGTPYLWGGNSRWGIDCSGLVQAALLACGRPCPGDSDQQMAKLGQEIAGDAPVRRGDLVFWGGHVALVSGPDMLFHANGFHMTTMYEAMDVVVARMLAQGDGPVLARKRL